MTPRFPLGTEFVTNYATGNQHCTVIDIYKTYNSTGKLIKIRYAASHKSMGQTVTDHDVCDTTIAKGLPAGWIMPPLANTLEADIENIKQHMLLASAAPQLLSALRTLVDSNSTDAWDAARAAINAAEKK